MLTTLLAGTDAGRDSAAAELADAGLWRAVPGGWQVCGWQDSQSTVAQIEANRERERDKKRRKRSPVPPGTTPGDDPWGTAPGDDPRGVRHGTARDETARATRTKEGESEPQPQAEPQAGDWPAGSNGAAVNAGPVACPRHADTGFGPRAGCRNCERLARTRRLAGRQ